jgi:hypothetical protein
VSGNVDFKRRDIEFVLQHDFKKEWFSVNGNFIGKKLLSLSTCKFFKIGLPLLKKFYFIVYLRSV